LPTAGHEAVHWSVLGAPGASDWVICEYAREREFVLVTNDLDFPRILAHTLNRKPCVILLRGEPLVPELRAEGLIGAIAECSVELDAGAVLTLDWSGRPRARLLPLR
jgi:predicted nuclease of predicted toxin-antitoxin system